MSDRRVDRLYAGLSARERAVLVLRACKEGRDEEPLIRSTMPHEQGGEFGRLIGLIRAANGDLAMAVLVLREQVVQLDLLYSWLLTIRVWGLQMEALGGHLCVPTGAHEDVAEGRASAGKGRSGRTGISDIISPPDSGRRLKKRAVKGGRTKYDICTDEASRLHPDRRRAHDLMRRSPAGLEFPVDVERPVAKDPPAEDRVRELTRSLVVRLKAGLQEKWRELRCIDVVLGEVAQEFDGEDPLRPDSRAMLEETKRKARELQESLRPYAGQVELSEPDEEELVLARKLVEQAARI